MRIGRELLVLAVVALAAVGCGGEETFAEEDAGADATEDTTVGSEVSIDGASPDAADEVPIDSTVDASLDVRDAADSAVADTTVTDTVVADTLVADTVDAGADQSIDALGCEAGCMAAQVCVRGQCRAFATATGCTTCPCVANPCPPLVGGQFACCAPLPGQADVLCVAGDECPAD